MRLPPIFMEVKMAWFAWDSLGNELKEVPWHSFDYHPDFVYENGVHHRKAARHIELWVETETREKAVLKMQVASVEFRDNYFK